MTFAPYVIDLVQHAPQPAGAAIQRVPFSSEGDFVQRWWTMDVTDYSRPGEWYSAMIDGVEMARVQLRIDSSIGSAYPTAPRPTRGFIEIVYIEVANHHLGKDIGPAVIAAIGATHPRRVLAALSAADGFWGEKMRWSVHEREDGDPLAWPLFVNPF